jgi:hypothetical protein
MVVEGRDGERGEPKNGCHGGTLGAPFGTQKKDQNKVGMAQHPTTTPPSTHMHRQTLPACRPALHNALAPPWPTSCLCLPCTENLQTAEVQASRPLSPRALKSREEDSPKGVLSSLSSPHPLPISSSKRACLLGSWSDMLWWCGWEAYGWTEALAARAWQWAAAGLSFSFASLCLSPACMHARPLTTCMHACMH